MNNKLALSGIIILVLACSFIITRYLTRVNIDKEPTLIITTLSDFHGQLEPVYAWAQDGTLQEKGGIARLATALKTIREQYPNKILTFGSGDYFTKDFRAGKYFAAFGGKLMAELFNNLKIDASTIGNHEFDFGLKAAGEAIKHCAFPFIATNLATSDLSEHLYKKLIVTKNGYKIGILGLMLEDPKGYFFLKELPKNQSSPLQLEKDTYNATQSAVNELKQQDKADLVVVLSHLGIDKDKLLAKAVDGIDIICGGHSHETTKTDQEIIVTKPSGKTIITHPGDRGLFLGILKLWPQKNGLFAHTWTLQEIDSHIAKDHDYEKTVLHYKKLLPGSDIIARTTTPIDTDKDSLRTGDNAFANFVADIIKDKFTVDIVLIPASCIRGRGIIPAGDIAYNDVTSWFIPGKNNYLIKLTASGSQIKQALESGVASLPKKSRNLLHVSGLRYTVDLSCEPIILNKDHHGHMKGTTKHGQRIKKVETLQPDGTYNPLTQEQMYSLIIHPVMIDDECGPFFMFKNNNTMQYTGLTEKDILISHLTSHKVISPNQRGRILFVR